MQPFGCGAGDHQPCATRRRRLPPSAQAAKQAHTLPPAACWAKPEFSDCSNGNGTAQHPIGTPKDIQARLSTEMARQIKDETEKFARLVKQANVVID